MEHRCLSEYKNVTCISAFALKDEHNMTMYRDTKITDTISEHMQDKNNQNSPHSRYKCKFFG